MSINDFKLIMEKNKLSFLFFFIMQVLIVIIIMFAYGVYSNSKLGLNDLAYEGQIYDPDFINAKMASSENVAKIKKIIPKILEKYPNAIEKCYITTAELCKDENGELNYESLSGCTHYTSCISVDKGKKNIVQLVPNELLAGRYLTAEDEQKDANVCILTQELAKNAGDTIEFFGKKYSVVGVDCIEGKGETFAECEVLYVTKLMDTFRYYKTVIMPLNCIPDQTVIDNFYIRFNRVITAKEVSELNDLLFDNFGNEIVSYPEGERVNYDMVNSYRTLIVAAILLAIIAAHSMSSIYLFILKRKEKETGILIVCGASKYKLASMYIFEMIVQLAIAVVSGVAVFQFVLRGYLDRKYKWFYYIFSERETIVYNILIVFALSIIVLTGISIALKIKKTPISIIKQN